VSAAPVAPPAVSVDPERVAPLALVRWFGTRIATFCIVELQKLKHDRSELVTRAIQPALWLIIFGKTFSRIHAVPTGSVPYLDYLAPGVLAQSTLFVSVFYGIQVIWERDAGVLAKLLVTPTPRTALVTGKVFAAGVRAIAQAVAVVVLALILGVSFHLAPWRLFVVLVTVMLGAAFFSALSMTLAGIVMTRDRLMGIGQAITMPLFFASNALYPVSLMPRWVRAVSKVNPLSYEVNALRGVLLGIHTSVLTDLGVLLLAVVLAVAAASAILPRLVR
jgi:ABC-2 type transport system permease protein